MPLIFRVLLFTAFVSCAVGQTPKAKEEGASKTKLEAFQARTGTVLIKGYTPVGKLPGKYGGSVEVRAIELRDTSGIAKVSGVAIDVTGGGRLETERRSFVDFDEIDSLLKGLDYVSKAAPTVTRLREFEVIYQTKGDFEINVFSRAGSAGEINAALTAGSVGRVNVFLSLDQLQRFRELVLSAKGKLETQ